LKVSGTFTSFLKITSPKEVTKRQESRFFLLFLVDDRRIRIWIQISDKRIRIQEAQKHMDLYPQHWYFVLKSIHTLNVKDEALQRGAGEAGEEEGAAGAGAGQGAARHQVRAGAEREEWAGEAAALTQASG
jgi:hypothetical protein